MLTYRIKTTNYDYIDFKVEVEADNILEALFEVLDTTDLTIEDITEIKEIINY